MKHKSQDILVVILHLFFFFSQKIEAVRVKIQH